MFVFNPAKMKKFTLWLLGAIASGTILTQVAWIEAHLNPWIARHPHWSWLVPFAVSALTLLHNPKAQGIVSEFFSDEVTTDPATGETTKSQVAITTEVPKE